MTVVMIQSVPPLPDENAGPRVRSDTPHEWQDDAACAQVDPELFFPEQGGSAVEPRRLCGSCPVRAECLAFALSRDEKFGIWGGLTARERNALKEPDRKASA